MTYINYYICVIYYIMPTNLGKTNIILFLAITVIFVFTVNTYIATKKIEKSLILYQKVNICGDGKPLDEQQINTQEENKELMGDVSQNKNKLVLYHTEWCGYSKIFLPEWEKIKKSELANTMIFEQYDCDRSKNICNANEINGYPSLIFFNKNGSKVKFPDNKSRNYETVMQFINENLN
jgi:thiol-disulfide isomerase/thioredoxin